MFSFDLPEKLITDTPAKSRDESKLMVINKNTGDIEHKKVGDLIDYFESDDLICLNNTKVFPARLYANKEKTGAKIEVFLLRAVSYTHLRAHET